jgi:membrane-anchored protein YejM (alkaline phosphatase superfamily)
LHVADQKNRERIQRQNTDINLKWTNTINSIDNQIETLSQIAQNWVDLERDIVVIEKGLVILQNKVDEIDFGEKSQSLLEEIKNNILVSFEILTFRIRAKEKNRAAAYYNDDVSSTNIFSSNMCSEEDNLHFQEY